MYVLSVTHNTSFINFIHGYMFRLNLRAIIRPSINADTGKVYTA